MKFHPFICASAIVFSFGVHIHGAAGLPEGVYFYRLRYGAQSLAGTMAKIN